MTVIVSAREEAANGIQPFDARRDLRQVAELIGSVFANELDANGRSALEEMEAIGRWSPVLGTLLSTTFLSDFVGGYVWLDNGRVVGNVTLQRQEESGTRWRISNVAVAEKYRQQGIARMLMLAALREIARRGGSWAVLQVRVDNPPARQLYDRLNFTGVCQDGIWTLSSLRRSLPIAGPTLPLQPVHGSDWRARFELAQAARPALAHWAEPVYADAYRPGLFDGFRRILGEMTGLQRVRRWGLWATDVQSERNGYLLGEVEVTGNGAGNNRRLALVLRPSAPPEAAPALLAQGLRALEELPDREIVALYNGEEPEVIRALEAFGFRPRRVLLTMRRLITPADATIPMPGLD